MNYELRILHHVAGNRSIQFRTKTKWYEGSTTTNGRRTWTDWKNIREDWEDVVKD